jgi:hypothetical protein
MSPDRYAGKPVLLLLESYVLSAIGALPPERHAKVRSLVQTVYGGGSDWAKTVRGTLGLNEETEREFRALWEQSRKDSPQLGAEEFARMVVEANFSELIR